MVAYKLNALDSDRRPINLPIIGQHAIRGSTNGDSRAVKREICKNDFFDPSTDFALPRSEHISVCFPCAAHTGGKSRLWGVGFPLRSASTLHPLRATGRCSPKLIRMFPFMNQRKLTTPQNENARLHCGPSKAIWSYGGRFSP